MRKKSKVTLICVTGIIIILTLRVFFILNSVGNGFAKYLTTQYPKLSFKVDSTKINFLYSNYYAKVTCLSDGTVFWISKNFNTKDISEDYYQYKSTSEYNSNLKDIFDGSDIQKYIASITGGSKSLFTENATYEQINVQLVNDVNPIDPIKKILFTLKEKNISVEKLIITYEKDKGVYEVWLSSKDYNLTDKEIEVKINKIK